MATLPSAGLCTRNSRPRQMRAQRGRWDLQAPAAPADAVVPADAALLPEADHVAPERLGCLEKNRGGLLGGHRETGVVLSQTDLTQGVAGPPRWSRSGQRRRCWLARGLSAGAGPPFQPAGAVAGAGEGAGRGRSGWRGQAATDRGLRRDRWMTQAAAGGRAGRPFGSAGAVTGDRRGRARGGVGAGGAATSN